VRKVSVPAQVYSTVCFRCRSEVVFPVFLGGGFRTFGTYRGPETGDFYRLDLDSIYYQKIDLKTELKKASVEREGGVALELVPDELSCTHCGEPVGLSEAALNTMRQPEESSEVAVLLEF
jgi:hypothetical protein